MAVTPDTGRNEGPSVTRFAGGVLEVLIGAAFLLHGPTLFGDGTSSVADLIFILGGSAFAVDGVSRALTGKSAIGFVKDLR